MVARHGMPGNVASRNRPVGYGMIGWRGRPVILESGQGLGVTDHTVPCGTDHVRVFSRHFMPGYHHVVPPGQMMSRLVHGVLRVPSMLTPMAAVNRLARSWAISG
jgi:hypothetical protein